MACCVAIAGLLALGLSVFRLLTGRRRSDAAAWRLDEKRED